MSQKPSLHTQHLKTRCPVCTGGSANQTASFSSKARVKPPTGVARIILEDLVDQLEEENSRLRRRNLELQSEVKQQSELSDGTIESLKLQNSDLLRQLKKNQEALTTATDEMIRTKDGSFDKIHRLQDRINQLTDENKRYSDSLDKLRRHNEQLVKACTSSQRDSDAILHENNQIRSEAGVLEKEIERLRSRNADCGLEIDELKLTIRRLEGELKRAIEKTETIVEDARTSRASEKLPLVIENSSLREENERLRAYIRQLTERFRATTHEIHKTGTDIRSERKTSPPRFSTTNTRSYTTTSAATATSASQHRTRFADTDDYDHDHDHDHPTDDIPTLSLAKALRKAAWTDDSDNDRRARYYDPSTDAADTDDDFERYAPTHASRASFGVRSSRLDAPDESSIRSHHRFAHH